MPRKRSNPMIGLLSELLISGNLTGLSTEFTPTSPSPRSPGPKNYDLGGGVGLGIVAALEKSSSGRSVARSDPIPVGPCKISDRNEVDEETITYVTSHRPGNKSFTRVYYDAGEYGQAISPKSSEVAGHVYPTSDFLNSCNLCKKQLQGKDIYMYRGEMAFCSVECRSRQIMVDEKREQQCRSEVGPRSADVSSSPYTASPIFSTGIVAI